MSEPVEPPARPERRPARRPLAAGLGAAVVLAAGLGLAALAFDGRESASGAAEGGEQPNVVVIMTDDQTARSIRVMPTVRRELANRGTTFTDAVASFPLCCPSRVTFLTGQYAHNHGVLGNHPPEGSYTRFVDPEGTLPESLQEAGYRTGHVGKYLNKYGQNGNDPTGIPPGWDRWVAFPAFEMFDYPVNYDGRLREFGSAPRDYQTDVIARMSARFLDESAQGSEPFFLSVAPLAPHTESSQRGRSPNPRPAPRHAGRFEGASLPRPPSFNERDVSDKPAYVRSTRRLGRAAIADLTARHRDRLASLLAVDDLVGRLVAELRAAGELDETIIVFTSDNGYLQGEHRLQKKSDLYEESARVPLILRGPGIPAGIRAEQVVSNADLAPTIIDAAHAEPGRVMDGRSLLALARDPSRGRGRAVLLENDKARGVRTRRYMYARHRRGEAELYDLRADPFQLRSRAGDPRFAAVESRMAERLRRLRECAGEDCR